MDFATEMHVNYNQGFKVRSHWPAFNPKTFPSVVDISRLGWVLVLVVEFYHPLLWWLGGKCEVRTQFSLQDNKGGHHTKSNVLQCTAGSSTSAINIGQFEELSFRFVPIFADWVGGRHATIKILLLFA